MAGGLPADACRTQGSCHTAEDGKGVATLAGPA